MWIYVLGFAQRGAGASWNRLMHGFWQTNTLPPIICQPSKLMFVASKPRGDCVTCRARVLVCCRSVIGISYRHAKSCTLKWRTKLYVCMQYVCKCMYVETNCVNYFFLPWVRQQRKALRHDAWSQCDSKMLNNEDGYFNEVRPMWGFAIFVVGSSIYLCCSCNIEPTSTRHCSTPRSKFSFFVCKDKLSIH